MKLEVLDIGLVDFKQAWFFQGEALKAVRHNYLQAALILCQHYPVITLGRSAKKENVLVSGQELKKRDIPIYEIERGGDASYHGPGQLMAYPVFNLHYFKKDIHWFLRQLEETIIGFISGFAINAVRYTGLTGVWVDKNKIASIGIAIKNWSTFHGISINIKKDDLANFSLIKPCGMNIEMTSLETILGEDIAMEEIKQNLIHKFQDVFFITPAAPLSRIKEVAYD